MDSFELLVQAHRPGMKATLARLVAVLRAHDVRYVIGGANALSLYVRPRMTTDIDLLVDAGDKHRIAAPLRDLLDGGAEIDIRYASSRAEDFALAHSRDAVILGTALKAPSPEALLWLYLVSENEQNQVDALRLLRTLPTLDVGAIRAELEKRDPKALAKLEKLVSTAREPESSYESYRARRS